MHTSLSLPRRTSRRVPSLRIALAGFLALRLLPDNSRAAEPPLRVEPGISTVEWIVRHRDQPVLVYSFAPGHFKPYVKELGTPDGLNLLRDAPHDHLHHHALMFAIRVNGINFWEETPGCGVQKPVETAAPTLTTGPGGQPQAVLRQLLHWVPAQDAFLPDTTTRALLLERRTLTLTVDAPAKEVTLRWQSAFEVGAASREVELGGANYFGLGARFRQDLDPLASHFTADGAPDLSNNRQDVSQHPWTAVAFDRTAQPATFAIFGHPNNAGGVPWFFSMKTPFAYLSATQRLDQQPLRYRQGDHFTLDYLVVVNTGIIGRDAMGARYQRWVAEGP